MAQLWGGRFTKGERNSGHQGGGQDGDEESLHPVFLRQDETQGKEKREAEKGRTVIPP